MKGSDLEQASRKARSEEKDPVRQARECLKNHYFLFIK